MLSSLQQQIANYLIVRGVPFADAVDASIAASKHGTGSIGCYQIAEMLAMNKGRVRMTKGKVTSA
jgi:hypothetical protein